jgi:hypothetical protein
LLKIKGTDFSLEAEGTVLDSGTTMIVAKLGKRLPDDLAEAKESKVEA